MSRRKIRPDSTYGQLTLECPHDHVLGAIVLSRQGKFYRLDRPLSDATPSADMEPLTPGEKVKMKCPACHSEGRHRADYQASWERIAELVSLQLDTRSEHRVLKLD